MKPRNPFMIMVGEDYVFTGTRVYVKRDWDGSKFATKKDAEYEIQRLNIPGATVVEILDETRHTSRA